jgi:hypothetical protein
MLNIAVIASDTTCEIVLEAMKVIPSEDEEQSVVVNYLRLHSIPHFHVPNSTFTKSWSQKRKNTMLGVVPGVPDLFFCVGGKTYAIEMKRKKMGVVSSHQKEWLGTLNNNGLEAIVARGAGEAIDFIDRVKV